MPEPHQCCACVVDHVEAKRVCDDLLAQFETIITTGSRKGRDFSIGAVKKIVNELSSSAILSKTHRTNPAVSNGSSMNHVDQNMTASLFNRHSEPEQTSYEFEDDDTSTPSDNVEGPFTLETENAFKSVFRSIVQEDNLMKVHPRDIKYEFRFQDDEVDNNRVVRCDVHTSAVLPMT
ncbi:branched-chain amino acid aminotransferase/4-amino-4-deoxychorismate lyase [Babesia caballi]|uniref:Branched-chain amino acid aminotransferase/4-amino-4-deoxychorismate lyase n=1 Tax=Babesia caballi TaxID=5871 RepID=A0AAV4M2G2_BABCB|nr:branched-chain amino acid aminotransferase/4-amino-4-deoxychorismate lyase [Babesia caballi]